MARRDDGAGDRRVLFSDGHLPAGSARNRLRRRFVITVVVLALLILMVELGELFHLRR